MTDLFPSYTEADLLNLFPSLGAETTFLQPIETSIFDTKWDDLKTELISFSTHPLYRFVAYNTGLRTDYSPKIGTPLYVENTTPTIAPVYYVAVYPKHFHLQLVDEAPYNFTSAFYWSFFTENGFLRIVASYKYYYFIDETLIQDYYEMSFRLPLFLCNNFDITKNSSFRYAVEGLTYYFLDYGDNHIETWYLYDSNPLIPLQWMDFATNLDGQGNSGRVFPSILDSYYQSYLTYRNKTIIALDLTVLQNATVNESSGHYTPKTSGNVLCKATVRSSYSLGYTGIQDGARDIYIIALPKSTLDGFDPTDNVPVKCSVYWNLETQTPLTDITILTPSVSLSQFQATSVPDFKTPTFNTSSLSRILGIVIIAVIVIAIIVVILIFGLRRSPSSVSEPLSGPPTVFESQPALQLPIISEGQTVFESPPVFESPESFTPTF